MSRKFDFASCRFLVRTPVEGGHRYDELPGTFELPTSLPPTVGDVVASFSGGPHVVVARMWTYPSPGSPNWREFERTGNGSLMLTVILDQHPGLFADEVYDEEDE